MPDTGVDPDALAVSPDSRSVSDGKVLEYAASRDGTLTPNAPAVTAGRYPFGIVVSARCSSRLFFVRCRETVYVANSGSNDVSQYRVGAGGALSPLSPTAVPAGSNPLPIAVSPAAGGTPLAALLLATGSTLANSARLNASMPDAASS